MRRNYKVQLQKYLQTEERARKITEQARAYFESTRAQQRRYPDASDSKTMILEKENKFQVLLSWYLENNEICSPEEFEFLCLQLRSALALWTRRVILRGKFDDFQKLLECLQNSAKGKYLLLAVLALEDKQEHRCRVTRKDTTYKEFESNVYAYYRNLFNVNSLP